MGKTFRHQKSKCDDDKQSGRRGKHVGHANGRKTGGMRIINDGSDDLFDDDVEMTDDIIINKFCDDSA